MEAISSASDDDLEDGEIIDDSDSDLNIFNISDSKPLESKHSSSSRDSGIHLIPLRSPSPKKKLNKSKENKKVDPDPYKLLIKIPGKIESGKTKEDRPKRKTRCHHRRKKVSQIYEDWSRSISLLTSPKKRKKTNASPPKYSSCESLNSEWRNSKKACPEPKLSPAVTKGNALLAKLVGTGDINPTSVILKEKNEKNVEKSSILHSDVSAGEVSVRKSVEKSSVLHNTLSSSVDEATDKNTVKPPAFSDVSSNELVAQDLIMKNLKSSHQNLLESSSSVTSSEMVKTSSRSVASVENQTAGIENASKTSEIFAFKSQISEGSNDSILIVSQLNLGHLKSSPQCDDIYSPETFIPFDLNDPQNSDTSELASENDFLSENYDCIPMSCSEDEETSVDSKKEKRKDVSEQQRIEEEEDEEEEELRLRISALKTCLQRKYAKKKPSRNLKNYKSAESKEISNVIKPSHASEDPQCPTAETKIVSKQSEEKKLNNPGNEEAITESEDLAHERTESSFIDDEACENYEQALRSLLVSNLLKKKLKNSNELLTESCLINKKSSSLKFLNKPSGKNTSKAISSSRSGNSQNVASCSSKSQTVKLAKNSNQALKNSANKSDLINCDNFQSKYVFSNFYESSNQLEDIKYLSSISNFKLPIIDKFIIHLSEDSDYDSDESQTENVTQTSLQKKNIGSSESNCAQTAAVKPAMDVPSFLNLVNDPSEPSEERTTADHLSQECGIKSPKTSGKENGRLTAKAAPDGKPIKVTSITSFKDEKFSDSTESRTVEPHKNLSAATVQNWMKESTNAQDLNFTSSPGKTPLNALPLGVNGSVLSSRSIQETDSVSNTLSAKEKSKKASSVLVADVLVPVEKKLLKSRLNLLQNVDSMQNCVGACEENALKCSKSFTKIVQLQKALKQATADYKTQFSSLKTCLQSYKASSQKISLCLSDYAQTQKDCAKTGKQIIGANYRIPKEGMSAMALKFKQMKEKKLELLNNASIANEIKKANFSADASGKTISAALKNINLNHAGTSAENVVCSERVPSIVVTEPNPITNVQSENIGKDLNLNSPVKSSQEAESVMKEVSCDQEKFAEAARSDALAPSDNVLSSRENVEGTSDLRNDNTLTLASDQCCDTEISQLEIDESSSFKSGSRTKILSPPPLPKSLLDMLRGMDSEKSDSSEVFECQQKFKKYTPVFYRDSNRISDSNVDSVLCPFSLQGTCRDETCEFKHL